MYLVESNRITNCSWEKVSDSIVRVTFPSASLEVNDFEFRRWALISILAGCYPYYYINHRYDSKFVLDYYRMVQVYANNVYAHRVLEDIYRVLSDEDATVRVILFEDTVKGKMMGIERYIIEIAHAKKVIRAYIDKDLAEFNAAVVEKCKMTRYLSMFFDQFFSPFFAGTKKRVRKSY